MRLHSFALKDTNDFDYRRVEIAAVATLLRNDIAAVFYSVFLLPIC